MRNEGGDGRGGRRCGHSPGRDGHAGFCPRGITDSHCHRRAGLPRLQGCTHTRRRGSENGKQPNAGNCFPARRLPPPPRRINTTNRADRRTIKHGGGREGGELGGRLVIPPLQLARHCVLHHRGRGWGGVVASFHRRPVGMGRGEADEGAGAAQGLAALNGKHPRNPEVSRRPVARHTACDCTLVRQTHTLGLLGAPQIGPSSRRWGVACRGF